MIMRSEIQLDLVKNYQYQMYIISLKSKHLLFKQIKWSLALNGLAPLDRLPHVTALGSEQYATRRVERAIAGLWAMRGSKRSHTGGCQVRPLTLGIRNT